MKKSERMNVEEKKNQWINVNAASASKKTFLGLIWIKCFFVLFSSNVYDILQGELVSLASEEVVKNIKLCPYVPN